MKTICFAVVAMTFVLIAACSDQREVKITGPVIDAPVTYLYLKPFFDSKCAAAGCHDNVTAAAGYDMTTYAAVITRATAGDANSRLLTKIQAGGSMNGLLGDYSDTKIEAVRQWIVDYSLQEQ